MTDTVQVKVVLPRALKRRAFSALALREERFSRWLERQLETWLVQVEAQEADSIEGKATAHDEGGHPVERLV
jgi:hypothetical protein